MCNIIEWTPQEIQAYNKARDEKCQLKKNLDVPEVAKSDHDVCLPNTSVVKNECDLASASSWYVKNSVGILYYYIKVLST